ncbi:MAG: cation:proton antiporter [Candidatus Marinimicrobia bacterium]|nr:cation:proton antiporter [bacterium]MCG2715173.1 cation:proton antiporter [Candidatus Neomarinimicrobiota bacterium]
MGKKVSVILFLCITSTVILASGDSIADMVIMHRMMLLALQLGIILFVARLGNILFEKFKMPGVLGELTAGIIIGPFLIGAIPLPGFPDGLFPISSATFPISPELYGISTVASIVLLFMIGLETNFRLFLRYSFVGSLVGIGGVLFSFLFGDVLAIIFSQVVFGKALGFLAPPCLFLGVISTATSVGITARILSEQRKLDSPEGVTILAGAVIDDVLGIILLAVGLGIVTASSRSGNMNWAHIGVIAAKAIGIWLTATVIGLLASSKISLLLKWFRDRTSIAMMAFGFALVLAGLFEEAGLAMIIGAYVMGLSLSKTDINHVVMEKMGPIYSFLVPVFFTVMGMLVNVRLFASRTILLFGIVYTVGAIIAKVLGCGIPTLFANFNLRGALRIGVGMLPRGEVALIIAGIGLASGLLSPEVFSIAVLMTLITTLISPPILVALFAHEQSGIRKQIETAEETHVSFQFPNVQTASLMASKLFTVFESEGFFVHTLIQAEHIYQLRKDEMIIGVHIDLNTIEVDCDKSEVSYINTAMYEVLAEFEATVKALRKPINGDSIARRIQERTGAPTPVRSELAQYLTTDVLTPSLKTSTKSEIIDELLEILNYNGLIKNYDLARKTVFEREDSMSTGIQFGIAIPHGRCDAVDRLICAIGIKRDGVDFNSIDGQTTNIIVLTLSPESASAPHMQFMSMVSQALDENGRKALLTCKTSKQMYEVLTKTSDPKKLKFNKKK